MKTPHQIMLALLVTLMSIFTVSSVHADDFDLVHLMQLLSLAPAAEVFYTEKKYSSLLTEPVVSSGTLAYRRPDTVEKNMLSPRKESFRIAGNALIVTRKGSEKSYPLSSQPLLVAFAASLRGVLGGDAELLRQHYRLALEGDEQQWRLEMTPIEAEITRYVERISVSGHADHIEQIEVRERSGDRSVLQVR
ncbi:Outer-membrane lipoprotein carrier protein [Georgfuchsia toluolica]|uniref:Outer-membrane lipoprotein carrier protein n=1 Tax=Georgfuchsia toluolica TaxID=424218 RepID=A0A916J5A6_9PROT|nr:LolA-related protein [Georgfuchsia toluolica]CAG4883455.1 Outer-membrane lipoprotein carrier protein [Georgfuchsia toluolica]